MNAFAEVMNAFYNEQKAAGDDYASRLAWETVIDRWDAVMKGVEWGVGVERFNDVMTILQVVDPENAAVWRSAKEYPGMVG